MSEQPPQLPNLKKTKENPQGGRRWEQGEKQRTGEKRSANEYAQDLQEQQERLAAIKRGEKPQETTKKQEKKNQKETFEERSRRFRRNFGTEKEEEKEGIVSIDGKPTDLEGNIINNPPEEVEINSRENGSESPQNQVEQEQEETTRESLQERYASRDEKIKAYEQGEYEAGSEGEKAVLEYLASRKQHDQATRDFYSKNLVGRAWAKFKDWRGKESEYTELAQATERFESASDARQEMMQARLKRLYEKSDQEGLRIKPKREQERAQKSHLVSLTGHEGSIRAGLFKRANPLNGPVGKIKLSDKEKALVSMRFAANRYGTDKELNEQAVSEALEPKSIAGVWWNELPAWKKRIITGGGVAGLVFATGGLATPAAAGALAGRMAIGGVAGSLAGGVVNRFRGAHLGQAEKRFNTNLQQKGIEKGELAGADIMKALREKDEKIGDINRRWGYASMGATVGTGIAVGLYGTEQGWFDFSQEGEPAIGSVDEKAARTAESLSEKAAEESAPGVPPAGIENKINLGTHTVSSGDNLWSILREDLVEKIVDADGSFDANMGSDADIENVVGNLIERIKDNPTLYGFESADQVADLELGQEIDLQKIYEQEFAREISVGGETYSNLGERASGLSSEQVEHIDRVQEQIASGERELMADPGKGDEAIMEAERRAAEYHAQRLSETQDAVYGELPHSDTELKQGGFAALEGGAQETELKQGGFAALEGGAQGTELKQGGFEALEGGSGTQLQQGGFAALEGNDTLVGGAGEDTLGAEMPPLPTSTMELLAQTQAAMGESGLEIANYTRTADGTVMTLADGGEVAVSGDKIVAVDAQGNLRAQEEVNRRLFGLMRENPTQTATRFMEQYNNA